MRQKRHILGVISITVFGLFVGCVKSESDQVVVGVSKFLSHPALDSIERGLVEVVERARPEVELNLQNANGEVTAVNTIAQLFQNNGVKLAVGITTVAVQALVQQTSGIPLFYTAVTSAEEAGILSEPETLITGYQNLTPVEQNLRMIQGIVPELRTIGQIYSSGEDNAVLLNKMARRAADSLGIELISRSVGGTAEVRNAALSLMDLVDAVYIDTDNQVVSALPGIGDLAYQGGIPLFTADPTSAAGGKVVLAVGFDYYKIGRAVGQLIVDYLDGKEGIFEEPVRSPEVQDVYVDRDLAAELGLSVPEDISDFIKVE